jgi:hypothetical protein
MEITSDSGQVIPAHVPIDFGAGRPVVLPGAGHQGNVPSEHEYLSALDGDQNTSYYSQAPDDSIPATTWQSGVPPSTVPPLETTTGVPPPLTGPYLYAPKSKGDHWEKSLKAVEKHDNEIFTRWREDIDTLLVFVGLFSPHQNLCR